MIGRGLVVCLGLLAVAACEPAGSPCSAPAARELRTVDRLIAETRTTLARGYATEQTDTGFDFCLGGGGSNVGVSFCGQPGGRRTVAIDRAAEQRKLDALLKRRADLARQADFDAQMCRAGGA
jgi:hypothetical protein